MRHCKYFLRNQVVPALNMNTEGAFFTTQWAAGQCFHKNKNNVPRGTLIKLLVISSGNGLIKDTKNQQILRSFKHVALKTNQPFNISTTRLIMGSMVLGLVLVIKLPSSSISFPL